MSVKIGISPIAWQNDDLPDLTAAYTMEQALKEAREIGCLPVARGIAVRHTQRATEAGFAKKGRVGNLKFNGYLAIGGSKAMLPAKMMHDEGPRLDSL